MDLKKELATKARKTAKAKEAPVKLTTNMTIVDMIHAMEPEIEKALPSVITPERFTRMALTAVSTAPDLEKCTQMSFIAALMNAAQLGLEPNTPLGQAYLIPYENKKKGVLECQFQIGYKGMIDLVYRNSQVQTIQAQIVYEKDEFDYELGLDSFLRHRPALHDRGEMAFVYALFKMQNGGYGFEVLSREAVISHAERYSPAYSTGFTPWRTDFEGMAKKTAIKKVLKFAPLRSDILRAVATDETVKSRIGLDMTEIAGENYIEGEIANEQEKI